MYFLSQFITLLFLQEQNSTDEDECVEERANPSVISHFGIDLMNFPRSELRNGQEQRCVCDGKIVLFSLHHCKYYAKIVHKCIGRSKFAKKEVL